MDSSGKTLSGKVSIVTGAGRGIGKAIALLLSREGSRVVLGARSESELKAVEEEIRQQGGEALVVPTDLARDEELERLVAKSLAEWGSIDHLINNAGWGKTAPVTRARASDWDQTFRVNLRAPMLLSQLVLPTLMAKQGGAIVNIGSISGKAGSANSAYPTSSASAAALDRRAICHTRASCGASMIGRS